MASLLVSHTATEMAAGRSASLLAHNKLFHGRYVCAGYFQKSEAWYLCFDPTLMSIALLTALAFDFAKRLPQTVNPALTSPVVHNKSDLEMQQSGGKHIQVTSPSNKTTNGDDGPE